jgi:lipopolysaccharide transport system ATP-binding protein
MSNVVLKVENLSKQYRLGIIGHQYLFRDIQSWWARIRGKDDPNLKINLNSDGRYQANHVGGSTAYDGGTFLALKDVDFAVDYGERIGIIGRNGAGKSTLLKIISRITSPTRGVVKFKGRVASLLEVGTGFHPELTGRENIYLNGAILGMTKTEIASKFDEIVDFSGVEMFIVTPVKRYSSGMYVRLAFAVAAHLEPEILVVDEVLAVGDSEFQKKCLGKMKDISEEGGRTILFVSHNMGAIQSLCGRVILLSDGQIKSDGPATKVVSRYMSEDFHAAGEKKWPDIKKAPGNDYVRVNSVRVVDQEGRTCTNYDVRDPIAIEIKYAVLRDMNSINTSCCFFNHRGEIIFHSRNDSIDRPPEQRKCSPGFYVSTCRIPPDLMNDGQVIVQVAITDELEVYFLDKACVSFNVLDAMDPDGVRRNYVQEWPPAAVRPLLKWTNHAHPLKNSFED